MLAYFVCFTMSAAYAWTPEYTADGQIRFPEDYREWVFLSSGSGMTYGPLAGNAGRQGLPLFDNVFVNRESYRSFLETGHWPDKTMFVLEVRSSEGHASINQGGYFQRDLAGIEAEVKDRSSAAGEWTFYSFPAVRDGGKPAPTGKAFPRTASCYSCHGTNTAVENTFVQFYPVLYDIAERKGTLKPDFRRLPITTSKLADLIRSEGWPAGQRALADTVLHAPDAGVLSERSLEVAASRLAGSKPSDAVSFLEWATNRYSTSASLEDRLAEAYLAAGDKEASRRATGKALELVTRDAALPENLKAQIARSAKERLEKLK